MIPLGSELGLSYCALKRMETGDLLGEMVAPWLKEEYKVTLLSGSPSWNSLVDSCTLKKIHMPLKSKLIKA